MLEIDNAEKRRNEERYFDTQAGEAFTKQDMTANVIGRKVMKTQDGKLVAMASRDQVLINETGMNRRQPLNSDGELNARVPQGDYTQTRPVTIYTEALERKNTYMSCSTGTNPFAKTSGFTQPLQNTRAVTGYEGNVDFAKETAMRDFVRTQGTNLVASNPYMQKHCDVNNFEEIKKSVMDLCKKRSANGLRGLRVMFKAMDRNGDGTLSPIEFKYAMRDYGLTLSEMEVTQIVKYFDTNKDGKLSFDEFLRAIRGALNARRLDMVHQAYNVLDKDKSGQVTIKDIEIAYVVDFHPDFQSG